MKLTLIFLIGIITLGRSMPDFSFNNIFGSGTTDKIVDEVLNSGSTPKDDKIVDEVLNSDIMGSNPNNVEITVPKEEVVDDILGSSFNNVSPKYEVVEEIFGDMNVSTIPTNNDIWNTICTHKKIMNTQNIIITVFSVVVVVILIYVLFKKIRNNNNNNKGKYILQKEVYPDLSVPIYNNRNQNK